MIALECDLLHRVLRTLRRFLGGGEPYSAAITFYRAQPGKPNFRGGAQPSVEYFVPQIAGSIFLSRELAENQALRIAAARGVEKDQIIALLHEHLELAPLLALKIEQSNTTAQVCIPLINFDLDRLMPIADCIDHNQD